MAVAVVVVNWNTRELLADCLASLDETVCATDLETWVVDNGSTDGSVEMVRGRFPRVHLIANEENVGFVRANNQALARCRGEAVLLLNSDTRALPGSIDRVVRWMDDHPRAGMVGVQLLHPDGRFQASCTPFPTLWQEFLNLSSLGRRLIRPEYPSRGPQIERGPQRIAGYVEGAFMLARRAAVDEVGGLDERIFMYAEEVDWCYRFHQAGWEIWYLPGAPIIHHGGQSSRQRGGRMEAELYRSRVYFFRKHYGRAAAWALTALIYGLTVPKMLAHRVLRIVSRGRRGRVVTGWRDLCRALGSVVAGDEEILAT